MTESQTAARNTAATLPAQAAMAARTALATTAESQQYLTFSLGSEMFAVGILNVKEIIEYGGLTEIPMMPPFIRGVINLRGAVVPVVDLAARFGGTPSVIQRRSCIVILEIPQEEGEGTGPGHQDIGIVVDAVSEVLDIAASEIEPPPTFGARIRADFISGMGKVNQRFVIILDIRRVLSIDDLAMLAAVSVSGQNEH